MGKKKLGEGKGAPVHIMQDDLDGHSPALISIFSLIFE